MVKFVGEEGMSPVQLALETARFQLVTLHGLVAVSEKDERCRRAIDNTQAIKRIDEALRSLGLMETHAD